MKKIIRYSSEAERWLTSCPPIIRNRIIDKIVYFSSQPDLYKYAKKMRISSTYRFRVGHYRVIFRNKDNFLDIITIGKRDEIYR